MLGQCLGRKKLEFVLLESNQVVGLGGGWLTAPVERMISEHAQYSLQ